MTFILRLSLLGLGLLGSYLGSINLKTASGGDLLVGGLGLFVAVICFFFLAKSLWRILGCVMTFALVAVIVGGIFYLISGSDMLNGLLNKTGTQDSQDQGASQEQAVEANMMDMIAPAIQTFTGQPPQAQHPPQQVVEPVAPPTFTGNIETIYSGDQFRVNGSWVRIFGIDAPEPKQTCVDVNGRTYNCGYTAARKLKELIGDDPVFCTVMMANAQGNVVAACAVGDTDIGAAMVEEGWAVALRNVTPVYGPYEDKARTNSSGMWEGKFYMPWDWVALQQKQLENTKAVKVPDLTIKPKSTRKSLMDYI